MENIKTINYNNELIRKIEKKEKTESCLLITSLIITLCGGACLIAGIFISKYSNFLFVFGGVLLLIGLLIGYILKWDDPDAYLKKARKYHNTIKNKTLLGTNYAIGKRKEFCVVELIVENDEHIVDRVDVFFRVVEKTDIEEPVLDLSEECVYIPYDNKTKEGEK